MVKLADTSDLGSGGVIRAGSSPVTCIVLKPRHQVWKSRHPLSLPIFEMANFESEFKANVGEKITVTEQEIVGRHSSSTNPKQTVEHIQAEKHR